jgi:hypothetical protein
MKRPSIVVHTYTMTVPCDSMPEAREVVARLRSAKTADVFLERHTKAGHTVRLVRGTDTVS